MTSADPSSHSMPPPAAIRPNSPSLLSQNHNNIAPLRSPRQSPYRLPQSIHGHVVNRERSNSHGSYLHSPLWRGRDDRNGISSLHHSPRPILPIIHSSRSSSSPVPPQMPCIPNLNIVHDHSVDVAIENERARVRELEKTEVNMDEQKLRAMLKRERMHSSRLAADLAELKSANVRSQAEAEAHEEGRINNLLHRLECLQKEKGRIIVELEREEEMLTNTLQKKLNEVRREKAQLEQQIEREHASNIDLKSQLSSMALSKNTPTQTSNNSGCS